MLTTKRTHILRKGSLRATLATVGLLAAGLGLLPATAGAALETVLQDDAQLLHRPEDQLRRSLEELRLLGVDRLRVTAGWSELTRGADVVAKPGFDATNPGAYEQERWRNLDRILVLAREYGFKTMVDIAFWAPKWASQDPAGERGRTEPDAAEYARFATAVARRYSGSFIVPRTVGASESQPVQRSADAEYLARNYGESNPETPAGEANTLHGSLGLTLNGLDGPSTLEETVGTATSPATMPLPKVELFTLWNEPNHTGFLRPQWQKDGKRFVPRSPQIYRAMVMAAYPAIKAVRPDTTVLIGGTSFSGTYGNKGVGNVPPLRFLRELACVNAKLRPLQRSGCQNFTTVPGDGYAHHPYSMRTEPDAPSATTRPDDVPVADLPKLAGLIDSLIARGRLAPGARNLWITEYGYETNPPDPEETFSTGDQVRFLTWAEYLMARVPTVRSYAQFLLRDLPPGAFRVGTSKRRAFGEWQSGLLFENGVPKLASQSFRAGLFVQRLPGKRLRVWGRLRIGAGSRMLSIERRPPDSEQWRTISTIAPGEAAPAVTFGVEGREAFGRIAKAPSQAGFRYRVRYLDGDVWRASPSVSAVER